MIICNVIMGICVLALTLRCIYLSVQHKELCESLVKLSEGVLNVPAEMEEVLAAITDELGKMAQAQNNYFNYTAKHHRFDLSALQTILAVLKNYMEEIQQGAAEDDDFEEAQHCQEVINIITRLVNEKIQ